MDELEISGKRYLSSRRAAKMHGYAADYIGQLIRADKVIGQKVGRAWYVEEASLKSYLLQEAGVPTAQVVAPVEKIEDKVEEVVVEDVIEEVVAAPAIEPAPIAVQSVVQRVEKVFEPTERAVQMHTPEKPVQKVSTLTYIEDTEPLLPVLEGRMRSNADFVAVPLRRSEPEEAAEEVVFETPVVTVTKRSRTIFKLPRVQTIAAVGLLAFAVVAVASTLLSTSIKVQEGQPASVGYTIK